MRGEDEEDTLLLRRSLEEARDYLRRFSWCRRIREEFFGLGVGGIFAVFLFHIEPAPGADDWLWIVSGDLPPAYLVCDKARSPRDALLTYCTLMEEWIAAARTGRGLDAAFPVSAEPTGASAELLEKRIRFLRNEVLSNL
jgi:hypothetical protein